jgi:hypothetical protein
MVDFVYGHKDQNIDNWGKEKVNDSQNIFEKFVALEG